MFLVRAGQDGQNGMTGPGAFDSTDSRSINQGSPRLSNRPQPVSHVSCLINNNPSKYAWKINRPRALELLITSVGLWIRLLSFEEVCFWWQERCELDSFLVCVYESQGKLWKLISLLIKGKVQRGKEVWWK